MSQADIVSWRAIHLKRILGNDVKSKCTNLGIFFLLIPSLQNNDENRKGYQTGFPLYYSISNTIYIK